MLRVPPWKLVSIIGDWIGNDPHCKTAGQNSVTGNCVTAAGLKDSTLPKNIQARDKSVARMPYLIGSLLITIADNRVKKE